MMTTFRTAQTGDYKDINLLSSNLGYESLADEMAQQSLDALLKSDADQVWLAVVDDQIIAWIHVFIARRLASAPFCEIGGMVVHPDYRRRELGGQLVSRAIKWASKQKIPLRVRCNTRRDEARAFYESMGLSSIKHQNVFEIRP